jgi:hypothetical protein
VVDFKQGQVEEGNNEHEEEDVIFGGVFQGVEIQHNKKSY